MKPNNPGITDNFLVYTKPEDFTDRRNRSTTLSYAAKFAHNNRYKVPKYGWHSKLDRKVLVWRPGPISDRHDQSKAIKGWKKAAQQEKQHQVAVWAINADIPPSIHASPSLQHRKFRDTLG